MANNTAFDIFAGDGFTLAAMTEAINKAPYKPRRISQLGIFAESGITTTKAMVEERDGVLYLVESKPRGASGMVNRHATRSLRELPTVHLPVRDRVNAESFQNVREFGSSNSTISVQSKVNEYLASMRDSLEVTMEYQRIGALKGSILDADGSTELANLFSLFEVTQETEVDFDLDNGSPAAGAVRAKCSAIIRTTEDNLEGAAYDSIHAFCGATFFDQLVDHTECREAYQRWNAGEQLRAQVARKTFFYAGIMFEEYRGRVGAINFIEATKAHFFPVGSPGLFRSLYAPAAYNELINTVGLPIYAKGVRDPADRWVDLYAESNPIHYCARPKVLMKGRNT